MSWGHLKKRRRKKNKLNSFVSVFVIDLINHAIHATWSCITGVITCGGSDYRGFCDGLFCLFFLVDFHGHNDDDDEDHQNYAGEHR